MRRGPWWTLVLAAGVTLPLLGSARMDRLGPLPFTTLGYHGSRGWTTFWDSRNGIDPRESGRLRQTLRWNPAAGGTRWAELDLRGSGTGWRTRVIVVELDPSRLKFELVNGASPGGYEPTWDLDRTPPDAVVAFNVGQFDGAATWGWVVHDGEEFRPAGRGPLALTVAFDSAGTVHFFEQDAIPDDLAIREAFQSYPTLLRHGRIPSALGTPGPWLDLVHRDTRLALGQRADGSLLVALTRFDGLGGALEEIPVGLTVPELAGLVQALGAVDAVALDGGLSAQLLVREDSLSARRWKGMRRVPLALVARLR